MCSTCGFREPLKQKLGVQYWSGYRFIFDVYETTNSLTFPSMVSGTHYGDNFTFSRAGEDTWYIEESDGHQFLCSSENGGMLVYTENKSDADKYIFKINFTTENKCLLSTIQYPEKFFYMTGFWKRYRVLSYVGDPGKQGYFSLTLNTDGSSEQKCVIM